jgi:hypothetical protein
MHVSRPGLRATYPCRRQHWARALIYAVCAMTSWLSMNEAFAANGMIPKTIEMGLVSRAIEQSIVNENYGVEDRIKVASNEETVVAHFLDQLPPDPKASELPAAARDVVIAKVRLLQSPTWNGPRHPAHPLRDVFFTQIKILDVRSGNAAIGAEYNIYFGREKEMMYPDTPEQLSREYIVMMYLDADDAKHRLVGFPISSAQYTRWQAEVWEYRRSQLKR